MKVISFIYNHAGHVVAVSRGVENDLVANIGLRKEIVSTIYNGYPIEHIKIRAGERRAGQVFTFITMGRCHQQKGQWHLIRSFAEFARKHENTRLIVLGEGSYTEYFMELIHAYHIEGKASLKGFVGNPYQELVNSDVFVFPSLWEGFANALLEAMICDLPVIASDFRSGAREILAPDTDIEYEIKTGIEHADYGIITPVCSGTRHSADVSLEPQELLLLEAMELIYIDGDVRQHYREASKTRASDFSIDKSIEQWCKLLGG